MEDFDEDEKEALRQMAKERIAYDTIRNKIKTSWILAIGSGVLAWYAFGEKIMALLNGTVK